MFSFLLRDIWQYLSANLNVLKSQNLKGRRAVVRGIPIGVESRMGLAKEVPRRTDGDETSGVRIRIIHGVRDYGHRNAFGDNASHNTLNVTMDYLSWEKRR
jgi:hypothetical protein